MTHLATLMLTDTKTANRKSAVRRLRTSFAWARRNARRTAAGRTKSALLRDVALGGTAASAANNYLRSLATGRQG